MTIVLDNKLGKGFVPNERSIVELQLRIASEQKKIEVLRREFNELSSRQSVALFDVETAKKEFLKVQEEQRVESEKHIDSLVFLRKNIGELTIENEKLEVEKNERLKELDTVISNIEKQQNSMKEQKDRWIIEAQSAKAERETVSLLRMQLSQEIGELIKQKEVLGKELRGFALSIESEKAALQDEKNFLSRKAADLEIYEKRVRANFRKVYPNTELKFI